MTALSLVACLTCWLAPATPVESHVMAALRHRERVELTNYICAYMPKSPIAKDAWAVSGVIEATARKYKLNPYLVLGIIYTESRCDPQAKNGSCLGLMQVSRKCWDKQLKAAGIIKTIQGYFSVAPAINAGCYVLAHYLHASNGDMKKALKRYGGFSSTETARFKGYYKSVMQFKFKWR